MCDFISRNKMLFQELDKFISNTGNEKNNLMSILHYAQNLFGYLPVDVQVYISEKLNISVTEIKILSLFYYGA